MKREMRKLNRVKYVYSEKEMQRLLSEGYVATSMTDPGKTADPPPGQNGVDGTGKTTDPPLGQNGATETGQTADLTQDQDGKSQAVDSGEKKAKRGAGKNDK